MSAADPLAEARAALFLDRPCPLCGAGTGRPCRSSAGKARSQVHAARKDAAVPVTRSWVQPELFGSCEAP